ncbi:MAG: cytochrome c maturation protein CcmE [Bacteroidales bacterium]|jgi:cytochrome c-type biogenesis protein CcmE|nr:cytochrome c maturation protein CcmE [Bacteroidales bacterium]
MKTKHIIILLIAVLAVGVIITTFADASTYTNFSDAAKHPTKEFHVIGKLKTDMPVTYDPSNPDYLDFYLTDDKGNVKKVVYHGAKPQDFEKSEQVVLTGYMDNDEFQATGMLLKCPSKYNDQEKPEAFENKTYGTN